MTISNASSRFTYQGNNATVNFSFPVSLAEQSHLRVILHNNTSGVDTNQTLNTAYNLSGSTDASGVYTNGVTVAFASAPSNGTSVVLFRDPPLTQALSLVENDPLPAKQLEKSYDLGVEIAQRLSDRVNRAITFPDGDVNITTQLPNLALRAGKYLAFDSATGDLTVANGTGNATDANLVNYTDTLAPSYLKTVSDIINGEQVSILRFIARTEHAAIFNRTTTTDVSANFAEAIAALQDSNNSGGLYVPRGTFVWNSNRTFGNTAATADSPIFIRGEHRLSVIKTTAAGITAFNVTGPSPDLDGAGNRFTGRVLLEKLIFAGPGNYGGGKSGNGLRFYGAQGIVLRDLLVSGWERGEYYQNVDIVGRHEIYSTSNNMGVDSTATGYAAADGGAMNSFVTVGGLINNNSNFGFHYFGGVRPAWYGTNFVANGNSLIFSGPGDSNAVTTAPVVHGIYLEGDTNLTGSVVLGGTGIVRGGSFDIEGLITANGTAIRVLNGSNTGGGGRGEIKGAFSVSGGVGSITEIDQNGSAEKFDYNGRNGSLYEAGSYVSFSKTLIGAGNSTNIASVSTSSQSLVGELCIEARTIGLGNGTTRLYPLSIIGGGTAATQTPSANESYASGAAPFNFTEIAANGTHNVLQITNTHSATCNYTCVLHIKQITGTLVLL